MGPRGRGNGSENERGHVKQLEGRMGIQVEVQVKCKANGKTRVSTKDCNGQRMGHEEELTCRSRDPVQLSERKGIFTRGKSHGWVAGS